MNILLLVKKFDFGGAECHVCDLANWFSEQGHNVIIASKKGRQQRKLHPKVKFVKIKFRDFLLPLNLIQIADLTTRYKVDVIHAHQRLPILVAAIIGFIMRKKTIATVHGQSKYDLKHYLSRRLISKVVFVSKKTFAAASKRFKIENKSVYIPNGTNCNDKIHDASLTQAFKISYISKISSAHLKFLTIIIKDVLPDIKKTHPDLKFCIIGDGRKKQKLEKVILSFNGSNNSFVEAQGYTASIAEMCLTSSLVMGAGRVALEAAALGTPVLSVNMKRLGGIIDEKKYMKIKNTNFIDVDAKPPDKSVLKQIILGFFENRNHYNQESLAIANKVREEFAIEKIANQTLSIYQN